MSLQKTPTTARKEDLCGTAGNIAPYAAFLIIRQQPSARAVRRNRDTHPPPSAGFSFTWMNRPDK